MNRLHGHDAIAGKLEKLIGETVAIALLPSSKINWKRNGQFFVPIVSARLLVVPLLLVLELSIYRSNYQCYT